MDAPHALKCKGSDLTATQWDSVESKLKFARQFCKFVAGGFREADFPDWFYKRLSNCFGHIAHYNRGGFYGTWFTDDAKRADFAKHTLQHTCYGDPAYTFSDVERFIITWMNENKILEQLTLQLHKARVQAERICLQQLVEKYGGENVEQILALLDFPVSHIGEDCVAAK